VRQAATGGALEFVRETFADGTAVLIGGGGEVAA
jgi:hypothetical protein